MTETSGFQPDDTAAAALAGALETAEHSCGCQAATEPPLPGALEGQEAPGEPVPASPDPGTAEALTERLRGALAGFGTTGVSLIAAERWRQVAVEGWTAQHDAHHDGSQLARAAACYALHGAGVRQIGPYPIGTAWPWPWPDADFKPGDDPMRTLVKAGALIAAEIDRLTATEAGE